MKEMEAEIVTDDLVTVPKGSPLRRRPSTVPTKQGNGRTRAPGTLIEHMEETGSQLAKDIEIAARYCEEQGMDPNVATVNDVITHSILHNTLRGSVRHLEVWLARTEGPVTAKPDHNKRKNHKDITQLLAAARAIGSEE